MLIFSNLDFVRFVHMLVDCDSRGCIWFWGKKQHFFPHTAAGVDRLDVQPCGEHNLSNTALCLTAEIRPVCRGEAK